MDATAQERPAADPYRGLILDFGGAQRARAAGIKVALLR
jgi:hypothetical protein